MSFTLKVNLAHDIFPNELDARVADMRQLAQDVSKELARSQQRRERERREPDPSDPHTRH
ncbi:hypothetical protein AB4Z48_25895 [Cupriavidus sp. 2TAF22]|uniref:hypothetical protein n=1 Tax=unclassified Cupriavidus TaxID=2640874 RepID=UPI003F8E9117